MENYGQNAGAEGQRKKRGQKKKADTKSSKSNQPEMQEQNANHGQQQQGDKNLEVNSDLISYGERLKGDIISVNKKLKLQRKGFRGIIHNLSRYLDQKGISSNEIEQYLGNLIVPHGNEYQREQEDEAIYHKHKYLLIDNDPKSFQKVLKSQREKIQKIEKESQDFPIPSGLSKLLHKEESSNGKNVLLGNGDNHNNETDTQKVSQEATINQIESRQSTIPEQTPIPEKPKRGKGSKKDNNDTQIPQADNETKKKRGGSRKKKDDSENINSTQILLTQSNQSIGVSNVAPQSQSIMNQQYQAVGNPAYTQTQQLPSQNYSNVQQSLQNISPSKENQAVLQQQSNLIGAAGLQNLVNQGLTIDGQQQQQLLNQSQISQNQLLQQTMQQQQQQQQQQQGLDYTQIQHLLKMQALNQQQPKQNKQ